MVRKIFKIGAGFALAMMIASCGSTNQTAKGSEPVELKSKEVNFENKSGSLIVNNETSSELVIFAGRVEKNALLGGIRKNAASTFDLSKISGIPSKGSLLIRAANYENYKGKARITEEDVVWTGLVVYDLTDSNDRICVSIYNGVDAQQQTCIYVSNMSPNFVLELRKGNLAQGEIIGTLPPLQRHKRIFLAQDPDGHAIDIYPTFIYVDPRTGDKTSLPGDGADGESVIPKPVGTSRINEFVWNGPNDPSKVGYKVAFVNLHNDTRKTLEFKSGGEELRNDKGFLATEAGRIDTYELEVRNSDGNLYSNLYCNIAPAAGTVNITKYTFKPGYVYDLTITSMNGTYEYDIREVGKKSLVEDARISLFGE